VVAIDLAAGNGGDGAPGDGIHGVSLPLIA